MYRHIKPVSKEDFFSVNANGLSYDQVAQEIYILVHTFYLDGEPIKERLKDIWQTKFKVDLSNEIFEYIVVAEPILTRSAIVNGVRNHEEINSTKYLQRTLLALEFDVWMIERKMANAPIAYSFFEKFIQNKYGDFLTDVSKSFAKYEICYITSYEKISNELLKRKKEIIEFRDLLIETNKMKIPFENQNTPVVDQSVKDDVSSANASNGKKASDVIEKKQKDESSLIIAELEDRISKLESDIKEYKRQRDEAREYSVNQYGRGIKDIFASINDKRYGKVVDYLFTIMHSPDADPNLVSYLENFFMALEDMEIEPIADAENIKVDENNLVRDYNLTFNKGDYSKDKIAIKYVGWKYKDSILEKPTLTMKED